MTEVLFSLSETPMEKKQKNKEEKKKEGRPSVSERRFCHNNARHVQFFLIVSLYVIIDKKYYLMSFNSDKEKVVLVHQYKSLCRLSTSIL